MHSLVTSTFLCACESWTFTAELQRRIQAIKMRCYRKILRISYKDHVTNEDVCAKIQQAAGPHEDLLTIVKRGKLNGMDMYPVYRSDKNQRTRHSKMEKKTSETEEDMRRQHRKMDRPGVGQVPEGSEKQKKKGGENW